MTEGSWFLAVLVLMVADVAVSAIGWSQGAVELNFLAASLILSFGYWVVVPLRAIPLFALWVVFKLRAKIAISVAKITTGAYLLILGWNLTQLGI